VAPKGQLRVQDHPVRGAAEIPEQKLLLPETIVPGVQVLLSHPEEGNMT
jgi:hypothetical protein